MQSGCDLVQVSVDSIYTTIRASVTSPRSHIESEHRSRDGWDKKRSPRLVPGNRMNSDRGFFPSSFLSPHKVEYSVRGGSVGPNHVDPID